MQVVGPLYSKAFSTYLDPCGPYFLHWLRWALPLRKKTLLLNICLDICFDIRLSKVFCLGLYFFTWTWIIKSASAKLAEGRNYCKSAGTGVKSIIWRKKGLCFPKIASDALSCYPLSPLCKMSHCRILALAKPSISCRPDLVMVIRSMTLIFYQKIQYLSTTHHSINTHSTSVPPTPPTQTSIFGHFLWAVRPARPVTTPAAHGLSN